jgi:hypothetical protein
VGKENLTMILIDNTQLLLSTIFTQVRDISTIDEDMVRHIALNTYRMYRTKFKDKYGEIVLCQDANSWRKEVFSHYKANRKKDREGSEAKWDRAFEIMSKIREEVKENFPYKNMRIHRCEADDVIAVLCKHFHKQEPILIISSDKDFAQLQQYSGVSQYSPTLKSMVVCKNPLETLEEQIIRGDSGDGVPNVLSEDDVFVSEGKRQKPITKKKFGELRESLGSDNLFFDDSIKKNWERNKTLIDLSQIPQDVEQSILNKWEEPQDSSRSKLLNYFIEHRLRNLMECIDEF